ncbi:hypothetical protein [Georgenia sp. AZ-5]|uniref:hypothetical protein n=1 Tax=Georgenia sp. AZ-5 TaxID=3367526 RepID=UPI0037540985
MPASRPADGRGDHLVSVREATNEQGPRAEWPGSHRLAGAFVFLAIVGVAILASSAGILRRFRRRAWRGAR